MLQKLLGVFFFSTVLVLSYVATLHIVTNRVDALHHETVGSERTHGTRPGTLLSGPVPLQPFSNRTPLTEGEYPVHKLSKSKQMEKFHDKKRVLQSKTGRLIHKTASLEKKRQKLKKNRKK